MAAGESALVPIAPDDSIESIASRIRGEGATHVQLLVPDGTAALQSLGGFQRLLQKLAADNVSLLLISSDEQTLNAARLSQVETVGVQGARVSIPSARGGVSNTGAAADRYATRSFQAEPLDRRDAEFLDALDQVPADDRDFDLRDEDADLYAALDDLPDTFQRPKPASRADARYDSGDDDFAAALDDWSDLDSTDMPTRPSARPDRDFDPAARRFNAADFDLAEDDGRARSGRRATGAQRVRAEAKLATTSGATARRPLATTSSRLRDYDEDEDLAPRRDRSRALTPLLIALVLVLVLAAALGFWFLNSRVTITITPPASAASEHPFTSEIIPLVQPGDSSNAAVQAVPVGASADAVVTGQVQTETLSPSGTAKGEITIINTIGNAVPIPKGSEFIGKNSAGQDVRFSVDNDVTVPGATSSSSLSGSNTTYGQINVAVIARSPGSASNVDVNSVTQLLMAGQQPIVSQNSNFIFQNAAITGGSEQPQRIVTEADVQAILAQALTTLYANGNQALLSQIDETKVVIDATTITPSAEALGDPKNYDPPLVEPAVGQPVDSNNPVFTVTVRANFNALVTPIGRTVADQLQTVVPQFFFQRPDRPCKASERQGTRVDASHWDGEKLSIDGAISCVPIGGLPPETISKVRDSVKNQPRDAAIRGMEQLKQEGLIGSYQLPDQAQFPRFDWLITVQSSDSPPSQPQPLQTQPTQSVQP
ncbi:MAG: hypothetical protein ABIV47_10930 [Roseiflexaceae bacterium]